MKRDHLAPIFVLLFLSLLSCSANKVVEKETTLVADIQRTLYLVDSLYAIKPRNFQSVQQAFERLETEIEQAQRKHFHLYWRAAKLGSWLALHSPDKNLISRYSAKARDFASRAIQSAPARVEGYYYRAIATGLFAREKMAAARTAMTAMRSDALKAIAIDAAFDQGGPHRLLGALYMRAPGAPSGIGSRRLALSHLKAACEFAPDFPENLLFLAELYIKLKQLSEATELLQKVRSLTSSANGDLMEQKEWQSRVRQMQRQLDEKK
ncbi:MAG: tetratricopeptide repeat protein [bacterium]